MTRNCASRKMSETEVIERSFHTVQIPTGWMGPASIGKFLTMISFGRKIQKARWATPLAKPDVIIGSSPSLHAAMGGLKLAKQMGVPFILEIRDLWPASIIEVARVSPANPIVKRLKKLERTLVRDSDGIITLLSGAADYYEKLDIPKDKFEWVPNGVDLQLFDTEKKTTRDEVKTVMYSGAHGQANGLFTLVEAAGLLQEKYPEIKFRFIGDGVLKERLQHFAKEEGIKTAIFDNAVSQTNMPSLMQEADIFVAQLQDLPLFKYGVSPNKIYEYMAASKPIVFGTTSPENPVTKAGVGPVVEPNNPKAVTDRIIEIIAMTQEERDGLGKKGRRFVQENNTFDVLAARVLESVQKALRP